MSKLTISQVLSNTLQKSADLPGVWIKHQGSYESQTWKQIYEKVNKLACYLDNRGFKKGDPIAILSETRFEWILADLAAQSLGCPTVPVYPTLMPAQVITLLEHSSAKAIFISGELHLQKLEAFKKNAGADFPAIFFDEVLQDTSRIQLDTALQEGAKIAENRNIIQENLDKVSPDDIASIIYTSGTTGQAKGVMLTHDNFMFNVQRCIEVLPFTQSDRFLSFLPLSHVLERMAGYYLPLLAGCQIAYAESIDTVAENMIEAKPTIMVSVPRLYEKIYTKVMDAIESGSPLKQKLFHWAVKQGAEFYEKNRVKESIPAGLRLKFGIGNKLVLSKIRAKTGNNLRFFISGGAPLMQEIGAFFNRLGIVILEGYGLTETSPVITMNPPGNYKFGTVGQAVPGVDLKIADDGEILTRSRSVMKGYYKNVAATAEAIDKNGWFHTGDIGQLDEEGFLKITDRKKNILVTSGGKNISPQPIEQRLKESPFIGEAVLIGDNRNFVAALVIPDFEKLDDFAQKNNLTSKSHSELIKENMVVSLYEEIIQNLMQNFARYEQIKNFCLLDKEFTLESGEYTPTLKVKRKIVEEKFKTIIEEMYS